MLGYKYFPPERKAFLNELLLRFTPPGLFNDPFDSLPAFSCFDEPLIKEKVEKVGLDIAFDIAFEDTNESKRRRKLLALGKANAFLKKQYLSNREKLDDVFLNLHRKRVNSEIGVLCLCENPKSVVMWWHYAHKHQGFVVGFETEDNFFSHHPNEPEDIGKLLPVKYVKERVFIDIRTIKEGANLPDFLFKKNREWSYEQEWRIIRFLNGADEIRDKNVHLFKVPPSAVRVIIIGYDARPEMVDELCNSQKKNSDLSNVRFFKAKLSRTRYEMDILPWKTE